MCDVPALRFPEFSGEWEKLRLSDFATKITKKNKGNIVKNVLCNSANLGLVPQGNYFDREIANTENTDGYYVICNGDFVYIQENQPQLHLVLLISMRGKMLE